MSKRKITSMLKAWLIFILITGIILIGGYLFFRFKEKGKRKDFNEVKSLKVFSSAFGKGEWIPAKYTCEGENKNPPLEISAVPKQAAALVLIVEDPDAPFGI